MAQLFSIEVIGIDRVAGGLQALGTVASDLTEFWKQEFAPRYFSAVQDLFESEGTRRGYGMTPPLGPWAALSPGYKAWKDQVFPGKKILELTGRLKNSLRWTGASVAGDGIFIATKTAAVAGTAVSYAPKHQKGTPTMPARPFLPKPDPAIWGPLMKDWILQQAHKRGLP